jgi:N-acetylneuraminic acid mutarotase
MAYKKVRIWGLVMVLILAVPVLNSCYDDDEDPVGNWVELSDFDGIPRAEAVGFTIGTKGYVGTGFDGDDRLSDLWEYDAARNTWTQKADFPGIARNGASGFGTDSKGYIGLGYDGKFKYNDFYEFDPATNTWTKKTDFPGIARTGAIAMTIDNKGYVGTGYSDNFLKDFWQYDPATDTWTQKSSLGGSKRKNAACFVIGSTGYVLTGIDNNVYQNDLWAYDASTDLWTRKNYITNKSDYDFDDDYTTIEGVGKVGFCIKDKGYLATGGKTTGTDVWEYNPVTDLWDKKTSFEGSTRAYAVGFVIDERGYVVTGKSGTDYFDDMWGFDPNSEYNEDD